jgi:hypothetical protein
MKLTPASGAAETRTLLMGVGSHSGIRLRLDCTTFVASSNCTVSVYDSASNTTGTIAFSAAGQWANLQSFENSSANIEWRVVDSYGCAISSIPAATENTTAIALSGGLGVFGASAPSSQPAGAAQAAVTQTQVTETMTGTYASDYANLNTGLAAIKTDNAATIALLNSIRSALVANGTIKGSA